MKSDCEYPVGGITTYTYGEDGRVSKITRGDGSYRKFEYHVKGLRVTTHNADGAETVEEFPNRDDHGYIV